ncbi:hypothetical protein FKM82_028891 [Ascaphus truei]
MLLPPTILSKDFSYQGTFAGILIGLAQLNCSELKLKRLCCRNGLLGTDKVVSYALNEWLTDIRKNQLPGILGGVGPMHSVVQLCKDHVCVRGRVLRINVGRALHACGVLISGGHCTRAAY